MNYIGEIRVMTGQAINVPVGWKKCDGQLLSTTEYAPLYSLLGTTYGGDGRTTFALPDLRARVPLGMGDGPGLTPHAIGAKGGAASVALTTEELPNHTHALTATDQPAAFNTPINTIPAFTSGDSTPYRTGTPGQPMATNSISSTGSGTNHENRIPFLVVTYIIAYEGVYPSEN